MLGRWIGSGGPHQQRKETAAATSNTATTIATFGNSNRRALTTGATMNTSSTAAAPQKPAWTVGQIVDVRARTWVGINRPGGTGRITKIHYRSNPNGIFVDSLDVKYTVSGGFDQNLDPDLVAPHQDLAPRGRRSRPQQEPPGAENQTNNNNSSSNQHAPRARSRNRSGRKPKIKKKRTPTKAAPAAAAQQQQPPPPHRQSSGGATNAVKKQFGRLTAVLSPNNKTSKASRQQQQRQQFFSPETAYAQNHRHRAIPADVPSEVILYANGESGSPESHISMCPSFYASSSSPPPNRAAAATTAATRNRFHNDVSMDVDECFNDGDEDRKLSPTHARLMEARTMARTVGTFNLSPSELERIAATAAGKEKPIRDDDDDDESMEDEDDDDDDDSCREGAIAAAAVMVPKKPRAHLTLREVFDDGYKKASKFIGDVVLSSSGINNSNSNTTKEVEEEEAPPDESMQDDNDDTEQHQRLHQFRTLLHEVLLNSEGMMEETAVARQMSDYTETEVGHYLTQLAAQNKIMQTDGWIYSI